MRSEEHEVLAQSLVKHWRSPHGVHEYPHPAHYETLRSLTAQDAADLAARLARALAARPDEGVAARACEHMAGVPQGLGYTATSVILRECALPLLAHMAKPLSRGLAQGLANLTRPCPQVAVEVLFLPLCLGSTALNPLQRQAIEALVKASLPPSVASWFLR